MKLLVKKSNKQIEKGILYIVNKWKKLEKKVNIVECISKDISFLYGIHINKTKILVNRYIKSLQEDNYRVANSTIIELVDTIRNSSDHTIMYDKVDNEIIPCIKIKFEKRDQLNKLISNIVSLYNAKVSIKDIMEYNFILSPAKTEIGDLKIYIMYKSVILNFSKVEKKLK